MKRRCRQPLGLLLCVLLQCTGVPESSAQHLRRTPRQLAVKKGIGKGGLTQGNNKKESFQSGKGSIGKPQPLIVGGEKAEQDAYPYFVFWGGCGATLIHNDIALTSAHCYKKNGRGLALVGAFERESNMYGAMYTTVTDMVQHPHYERSSQNLDVMLIKLGGWFEKEVIDLDDGTTELDKTIPLSIAGFGRTSEKGKASVYLQEADVRYYTSEECTQIYRSYYNETTMICAADFGVDSCRGDSGGPLLRKFTGGDVQVGVVSWGVGCARPQYPGVYARVSEVYEWIQGQICELSDNPPGSCTNNDIDAVSMTEKETEESQYRVRIDILHDEYPEDTGWAIVDTDAGTIVHEQVVGSRKPKDSLTLLSEYVKLPAGRYRFVFWDDWGDGLTVGLEGFYAVHALNDTGPDELLASGVGALEHWTWESTNFCVGTDC